MHKKEILKMKIDERVRRDKLFFFQAEDGIRDIGVTGVQTCALPIFTERQFVEHLERLSEGNFMYLRHVLPAIAEGVLRDRQFRDLPPGLAGYYADHLDRKSVV